MTDSGAVGSVLDAQYTLVIMRPNVWQPSCEIGRICCVAQGPMGNGVMDLYTPEISCQCGDNQTGIPSTAITDGSGVDLAKNVTAARAYDELHVQAVLNQINGKHSSGNYAMKTPNLFGLNFQAVSVGQKVSPCSSFHRLGCFHL